MKEVWLAVYVDYDMGLPGGVYETADECKAAIDKRHPSTYHWEWESSECLVRKDGWQAVRYTVGEWDE